MKFMLDANIVIMLLNGSNQPVIERISECEESDLAISAIAFAEIAHGSWRGKEPLLQVLDQLHRVMTVQPFDHLAAKCYADIPFKRGSYDRLIAAHALALNLTLITNNVRDFADVPRLRVENWTLPL